MHIGPICAIHIAVNGTFGFVCIWSMIGPLNTKMTSTLLAILVTVADFDGFTAAIQPFN